MRRAPISELYGGDPTANAATLEGILAGNIRGPKRDLAIVNAADGFVSRRSRELHGVRHRAGAGADRARKIVRPAKITTGKFRYSCG